MSDKIESSLYDELKDEDFENYYAEMKNQEMILGKQLKRFHEKYKDNISFVVEKIIKKYDSSDYYNRWIKRGIQPPEDLYWFLLYYAEKYGVEVNENENINIFTSEIYQIGNYIIQRMDGQGAVIRIDLI
jgi:hypothetical protein